MFVDSSALLAILLREPDAWLFQSVLENQEPLYIGAPSMVEATTLAVRKAGSEGVRILRRIIQQYDIHVVDFGLLQAALANEAYAKYGKGIAPAALNFGDCVAYGSARAWRAPLLSKGNDFPQTDLPILQPPTA